ncbi:Ribonuclease VapC [Beijerinckiaceae bacterium RH AL1]|jgi:tRNA(fMet)-specific endonuclease VapC|nr:type II toxin-antitoxin system VapC family toxin [Beijerinckiaceae bacterium]VVB48803.1 Ribonuclease VapC [Beijerinckiaceae bacterium RH CH11]VVB48882.1 Ribonuclease VapC [Beijerinckiaceae bacterium RH AL8]VVC56576.1 Ribonuclease VapC [Beijerinckiaceae bacterium RH AL1]
MRCLDTNVAIAVLNDSATKVTARFDALVALGDLALPAIVLFELEYGLAKSVRRSATERRLRDFLALPIIQLPFAEADAKHAADIRADLQRKGTPIGPFDTLIAAQARCRSATLVTANTREFSRVADLELEDWTS